MTKTPGKQPGNGKRYETTISARRIKIKRLLKAIKGYPQGGGGRGFMGKKGRRENA
jgi:hypothetical protein